MVAAYEAVYVLYPRGLGTGGPEAIHQLVDSLRRQGQSAFLVARPGTEGNDRVAAYNRYDAPEAPGVPDRAGIAVVASEDVPTLLRSYRRAERFVWWLSIDNSSRFRDERRMLNRALVDPPSRRQWARAQAASRWHAAQRLTSGESALYRSVRHLAQSQYAWSYLFARLDVLPSALSDYTDAAGIDPGGPIAERGRSIAYNPTKSRELMAAMRARRPDIRYVALEGLDRAGLLEALRGVAVYLDLGHHPGKDRLPREAALSGTVSIVARRGAGAFTPDVPTPWHHRVDPEGDLVGDAIRVVDTVFAEPDRYLAEQAHYRSVIQREQTTFDDEVERIFLRRQFGSDR